MSSIPQFLINETNKIIKNVTLSVFTNHISSISFFFTNASSSLFLNSLFKNLLLHIYNEAIIKIDKYFYESDYRKKYYYSSSKRQRVIVSIFGELKFERYYYINKKTGVGFYFIDNLFKFEKYKNYDPVIRSILINQSVISNVNITSNNSDFYLGNFEEYMNNNIIKVPRQTIYNWLKEWHLPKVEYECFENAKNLYVMVDEKWIHEMIRLSTLSEEERNKKHFIMSKCFVTFTGAKTKNNRTTLLNRHIFMTTNNEPWKNFMNEIYNIYNFEEIENIYLLSDSGGWILAGAKELKLFKNNKVILNTCEFHVKHYINRMVRNKDVRKELIKSIYEDKSKEEFTKLTDNIIEESKNNDKKKQYKNYILNHWKAILNMKDREVKSSMESHISHCIASSFGSRPKGYSIKRIEKYIKLQEYKLNGINIMDLYLKSYDKNEEDSFVYNKEDVSYSIFEHKTSSALTVSTSNYTSMIINAIGHCY